MHEVDPPKKDKWKTKKRLKLQRKREKQKRKAANKKDPRRLGIKGKKKKFANAEERIKYKLEKVSLTTFLNSDMMFDHFFIDAAEGNKLADTKERIA